MMSTEIEPSPLRSVRTSDVWLITDALNIDPYTPNLVYAILDEIARLKARQAFPV